MSRRDTIIIAVLVNSALLMVLFATAIRTDKADVQPKRQAQLAKAPVIREQAPEEDLLNQYVSSVPTLVQPKKDEPVSFIEEIELAYTPPEPIKENKVIETPKARANCVDVTVKKGDYLDKIATANNTTVSAIMEANGLASSQLKIGQVLKVPLSDSKPATKTLAQTVNEEYYTVKDGDNPWLIATRNNLRLDDLLRLNGLDEQKARRLRPGDRLRIR